MQGEAVAAEAADEKRKIQQFTGSDFSRTPQ